VPAKPWSFDRITLKGAQALAAERHPVPRFLARELPRVGSSVVELDDLVRFVERPVRAFLRQRLGISVFEADDEVEDALPVELDSLEEWGVGDRLLDARLAGTDSRAAYRAEIARGLLPPGVLGEPVIRKVLPRVEDIVAQVPTTTRDTVDVKVALRDGRTLRGTVPGVGGDVLLNVTYSRVNARHRIAAWVKVLALTAAHPGRTFEALTVGRAAGEAIATATIAPLDAGEALDHLEVLLDLYDRGMRAPPPLACRTSAAYAEAARAGRDPVTAARREWESDRFPMEDADPEHQLVLGPCSFDDLLAEAARSDEIGAFWDPDERSRFGRWARRLWTGLLQNEQLR
jgi:exodeoxyribonuclease V gamma subunit